MHPFPHRYAVSTNAGPSGDIVIAGTGLPALPTNTPVEFDGPGGRWSPEELLVAAVADCFVLTFRGIAKASRLSWISLTCDVTGTLDRVDRVSEFTHFDIRAHIEIPEGTDADRTRRIAARAEETCLITRSLKGTVALAVELQTAALATTANA